MAVRCGRAGAGEREHCGNVRGGSETEGRMGWTQEPESGKGGGGGVRNAVEIWRY
jgi:hypothetical protein